MELLMQLAGTNPSRREAQEQVDRLRGQGYHTITARGLQLAVDAFREAHPPEEEAADVESAWRVIDADGDGMLRGAELSGLSTLITTQGEPLSAEEAQEFFDELDADRDGVVRKWEYMRIMSGDAESTEERVD